MRIEVYSLEILFLPTPFQPDSTAPTSFKFILLTGNNTMGNAVMMGSMRHIDSPSQHGGDFMHHNDLPLLVIEGAHHHLNTTLCKDFCTTSCISYRTPLGECYNPQKMFPGDASWGESDILDDDITFTNGQVTFQRSFYSSSDNTCTATPETITLPLNECIGPFGAPRPWGSFELV